VGTYFISPPACRCVRRVPSLRASRYPHVQQRLLRSTAAATAAAVLPSSRYDLPPRCNHIVNKELHSGPPGGGPPGGGYYPQQPQQAYQQGYGGQPGYQPHPPPQPVYVYVRLSFLDDWSTNSCYVIYHSVSSPRPRRTMTSARRAWQVLVCVVARKVRGFTVTSLACHRLTR
jgi:hypothetical protein